MKRLTILLWFVFGILGLQANNVRIVEDVKIGTISGGVAEVTFKIAWDNSWRDDYNWDAVYVFMKTKKTTDLEWKHAYFMDDNNTVSSGYDCWLGRCSDAANNRQGVFIYRNSKGRGNSEVTATLRWKSGYTESELQSGAVEMSLQCIEMVYVPQGAFYLGDGASKNSLKKKFRQILPEWDLIDSHDKTQKYTASTRRSDAYTYSVSGPANRVTENYNHSGVASGNIYFTAPGDGFWQVEFETPKEVKYFGVSGLYNHESYRPGTWELQASVDGTNNWKTISNIYGPNEWLCEHNSYPVYNALPVKPENYGKYRFYRIVIRNSGNGAIINNVAMTEKDLSAVADDGFTVDGQDMPMNATTGLFADDGDTWSGTLTGSINASGAKITTDIYPNGFEGFYAMKYELSQEQYVRFLNKLNSTQQKARTREDLDQLQEGAYVFGTHTNKPDCRNGIVVGARSNGLVIFACNLTDDGKVSQEDDGQTVACNYISVNDMLAYADWAGLRPLSEMEYEKMGRRPYPQVPGLKGWAGGDITLAELPTDETFANGTKSGGDNERLTDGNVNAGGKVSGPVRVGSYASNANYPVEAGASYWGLMDLSGNLAEYYYNVGTAGRAFHEQYYGLSQGNGALATTGEVDINPAYWPRNAKAFALRGGSFMSEMQGTTEGEIALSDRSRALGVSSLTAKDSTATFRLGHSYTYLSYGRSNTYSSYLTLANGLNTQKGQVTDSVCVGSTYTIRGSELLDASGTPVDGGGKTTYIWYIMEANTWRIIPNENGKDLTLTNIRTDRQNVADANYRFHEFYVRREAIAPNGACHVTNPAKIYRINPQYSFNRLVDTLRQDNSALGFLLKTGMETIVNWRWKAAGDDASNLTLQTSNAAMGWYIPKRSDFNNIAGQNHVVVCDINFFNKCPKRQELTVFVEKRLEVGVASNDITVGGSDPNKECGVLMQDMRTQSSSRVYKTVKINGLCWMAENLRYDALPESGIKSDDPSGEKYGRLYRYNLTIRNNACPSGWRLPTKSEMQALVNFLGGDNYAGAKAKAGNYWTYYNGIEQQNTVGFSALGVDHNINVANTGNYAYFGTVADNSNDVSSSYYYQLDYNNNAFRYVSGWGSSYMSIRCVKR